MTSLKNKVSLVTGSARGIGKAIALRYGALGASVIVNYSADLRRAQETVAEIEHSGSEAIAVQADISKVADIDRLFATKLFSVGVGDLADKLGPARVHGSLDLAGLPPCIILEDFDHQGGVV